MLSENQIMNLLEKYANSPEGKKKIKQVYGIDYSSRQSDITKELIKEAEEMRRILYKHIKTKVGADLESGEWIHNFSLDDIIINKPQRRNGKWSIRLSLNKEAIKRESLYDDGYPDGVYDIILLLSRGYHARDYVYGLVNTGLGYGMSWQPARSVKDREPNPFLENAVNEFNNTKKGAAKASLTGEYAEKD